MTRHTDLQGVKKAKGPQSPGTKTTGTKEWRKYEEIRAKEKGWRERRKRSLRAGIISLGHRYFFNSQSAFQPQLPVFSSNDPSGHPFLMLPPADHHDIISVWALLRMIEYSCACGAHVLVSYFLCCLRALYGCRLSAFHFHFFVFWDNSSLCCQDGLNSWPRAVIIDLWHHIQPLFGVLDLIWL